MQTKYRPEKQLTKNILQAVSNYVNPAEYKIFIFGSRARNEGTERSDIDIGIEGPKKIPGYMMTLIRESLDQLPSLYSFDVVDFHRASKKIKQRAAKNIKLLNKLTQPV